MPSGLGQPGFNSAETFNLRCPRNGKTDECPARLFLQDIQLSSQPLSALNKHMGRR
jgi:hypothetical protein